MAELISSGIELMFAGMGIVFVFLIMLVSAINAISAVIQRYFPESSPGLRQLSGSLDKNTVAAIMAAVHQYRNTRR